MSPHMAIVAATSCYIRENLNSPAAVFRKKCPSQIIFLNFQIDQHTSLKHEGEKAGPLVGFFYLR